MRIVVAGIVVAVAAGCSRPTPNEAPASADGAARRYLLEQVDDAAIVHVYADGFSALPLRQKTPIWHLYQAAVAGRDVYIDQKHRDAHEMRGVTEQIVPHPGGVDAGTLREIQRYTKLFWINNGPYNNLTARKFALNLTPQALAGAVKAATASGATFAARRGESVDAMLVRLGPMFFDANVDPIVTNKTPGPARTS
jgi:dipeptidyl-peptidase-3